MRHGQTVFNELKKIQGWCDAPLTKLGQEQAKKAGEYFIKENIHFDEAYSSTSERASDTLELITDLPYKRLKGLKEWHFGRFEGESEDLNPVLPYGDFFAAYGGESELAFRERITSSVLKMMRESQGATILAVSHGGACAQFARHWEETSEIGIAKKLKNCCILMFEFDTETEIFTLRLQHNHRFEI